MEWLKKRASEPSTYAGLSAVTMGLGVLFKVNEAPQVATALEQAAPALSTGDYVTGGSVLLFGLLSAFMKEKR